MLSGKSISSVFRRRHHRMRYLSPQKIIIQERADIRGDSPEDVHLRESIARLGMIHPLIVRKTGRGHELVCGVRRLSAAKYCGFRKVPCIVVCPDGETEELLRLAENLQRQDPELFTVASGLKSLIYSYGFSIGEAADAAGLTFEEASVKLRLLGLGKKLLSAVAAAGLSEQHALALLRIDGAELREAALCEMAYRNIAKEDAANYVDNLLLGRDSTEPVNPSPTYVMKDVRLFLNSMEHGIDIMRIGGIAANCTREESGGDLFLKIRIPGAAAKRSAG